VKAAKTGPHMHRNHSQAWKRESAFYSYFPAVAYKLFMVSSSLDKQWKNVLCQVVMTIYTSWLSFQNMKVWIFQPKAMFLNLCFSPAHLCLCVFRILGNMEPIFFLLLFEETGKWSGDWQPSLYFCTREWTAQKTSTAGLSITWRQIVNVLLYFGSPVNSSSTVFYSAVSPTWGDTVISTFSLQTSVLLMGLPSPVLWALFTQRVSVVWWSWWE